jgi:hypothetical protein
MKPFIALALAVFATMLRPVAVDAYDARPGNSNLNNGTFTLTSGASIVASPASYRGACPARILLTGTYVGPSGQQVAYSFSDSIPINPSGIVMTNATVDTTKRLVVNGHATAFQSRTLTEWFAIWLPPFTNASVPAFLASTRIDVVCKPLLPI